MGFGAVQTLERPAMTSGRPFSVLLTCPSRVVDKGVKAAHRDPDYIRQLAAPEEQENRRRARESIAPQAAAALRCKERPLSLDEPEEQGRVRIKVRWWTLLSC